MEIGRNWKFSCLLLGLFFLTTTLQDVQGEVESEGPSESECRPYIEKALKGLEAGDTEPVEPGSPENIEEIPFTETTADDSGHNDSAGEDDDIDKTSTETDTDTQQNEVEEGAASDKESTETQEQIDATSSENKDDSVESDAAAAAEVSSEVKEEGDSQETKQDDAEAEAEANSVEDKESVENVASKESKEDSVESEAKEDEIDNATEPSDNVSAETEEQEDAAAASSAEDTAAADSVENTSGEAIAAESESTEKVDSKETVDSESGEKTDSVEAEAEPVADSVETAEVVDEATAEVVDEAAAESSENIENVAAESVENVESVEEDAKDASAEANAEASNEVSLELDNTKEDETSEEHVDNAESAEDVEAVEPEMQADEAAKVEESAEADVKPDESTETKENEQSAEAVEAAGEPETVVEENAVESDSEAVVESTEATDSESTEELPEEDLNLEFEIPDNLRSRDHIDQLLKLDEPNSNAENALNRVAEVTLKELKKLYENAIKPLETLYKYRDLSNRHFGDSEIFSKPLVLFMGPWSGGKSSIINYLTDNEYNTSSLRTGAEPSPAYFNLLMHGDEPEVLDGTQLAADNTFSGLQKFGQGLEERLRGLKLPNKLLEKINIVEIPGILEVRKQVSRVFPFNDACQWFIDRADIIFLVYDPSKLDVGPETEAILDQLKGREHQTRIVLNKADQVKPEELMRVQGALIWNISPLMSSAQPPVMYTTSLWSRPYETWAPSRLLHAQERAFLRDLRSAVDKRIENKISSARRFAVRVRNHAKMVDCYLTTYYNHKSVFGNRKQVSDQIIEHPQDYHIYEGLSTLTNISRYDLPDPDVYKDFFRLNPLYDFQQLSATCTYFRGCPINRLDVAIAYDFPELGGKHKKLVEAALTQIKSDKQTES